MVSPVVGMITDGGVGDAVGGGVVPDCANAGRPSPRPSPGVPGEGGDGEETLTPTLSRSTGRGRGGGANTTER